MKQKTSTSSIAELRSTIRATGLRSTGPRMAVLQRLQAAMTPVSHSEIVEALEPRGFDRATIYRNLMDLTEVGLLSRVDVGDHVWRFELRGKEPGHTDQHPHFVCTDCGEVACLPDLRVQMASTRAVPRAIRTHHVEVQLKGLCDHCAA